MRATERLLEYASEQAVEIGQWVGQEGTRKTRMEALGHVADLQTAVAELRRRGDTLVRREDLRTLLRHVDPLGGDPALKGARERAAASLGGT